MHYKGTTKPLPVIAQELSVRYVLEGSVRRAGNNLRITAQVIDAATDAHRWAEKYTGTLDDVFDLQERLSRRIVDALRLSLTPDEDRELAARPIQDVRAYDAWLRATNEAWSFTPGGFDRAFQHLNRALEIVGDNALLHAGLGYYHSLAYDAGIRHALETLATAEFHAARALELDPDLGQAHLAMAWVLYKRGGFSAGMRMMRRAAEKDRSIDALVILAFGLGEAGRVAESRQLAQVAIAAGPLDALETNAVVQEAAKTDEWYPNFIAACLAKVGDHAASCLGNHPGSWLDLRPHRRSCASHVPLPREPVDF